MSKKLKPIVRDDLLGPIEHLVMRAVASLGRNEAYGMTIFDTVRNVYPAISFGSVYTSLDRLTWKGFLEKETGEPEPVSGGRARKYYQMTSEGKKALDATRKVFTGEMVPSTARTSR